MPRLIQRCCLLSIVLSAFFLTPALEANPHRVITRTIRKPPTFEHIDVSGYINVVLIQDKTLRNHIALTGPRSTLNNLNIEISSKTLHINLSEGFFGGAPTPIKVHIYMPKVQSIAAAGHAKVNAYFEYQSTPLALHLRNQGFARINGLVNVNQVVQSDTSKSHIVFSDSGNLDINLHGYSNAYLAGRADRLFAKCDGNAILNAKHLRAEYAWLQNTDHGVTMLSPLTQLDAFATEHANIIAMTSRSLKVSHFSRDHGNVLTIP